MKKEYSNVELLDLLKSENLSVAYTYLYDSVYPFLRNFVIFNNGVDMDAEDVFQDALLILETKIKNGFAFYCSVGTIVYNVGKKLWIDKLRQQAKSGIKVRDIILDNLLNEAEVEYRLAELQNQRERLLNKHFDRQSQSCINILKLYMKGVKSDDIAKKLGYSGGGDYVRKRMHQCKQKLLALMKQDPEYGDLFN
ncbi:MAG: RNA polymerase sigma factor [Bacteroidales bacterium]|jgi:RNA polymerase sigma factor (sigma-70 family)|nr:RNA polymerase sigma factor [Bacteroidales bacterium]MDD2205519.1 RNA polymerase sigma factor [Bacteroidales bacterium]MDD3152031.1 RNA polymerase sigma factor [Bacteroidales bacterium]MDD3914477.1 RNA polymerase sigma factor [Bacteroidales bacterium]MDD4634305.1 RNA polymerase sigma factor [Bacteroidales bacterium]